MHLKMGKMAKNQADEQCRAGMVWFCFFCPGIVGESGIGSFFRFCEGFSDAGGDAVTTRTIGRRRETCTEPADIVEGAMHRVLREVGDEHDGEDFDDERQN